MPGVYDIDRLPGGPRELQDIIRRIFTDNGNLTVQINKLKQENGWLREVIAARNHNRTRSAGFGKNMRLLQ
jgi:hypothetical protein